MKLLVFDGNSIVNRAFYAIKALTTKEGVPTNALHGFLKLYFKYFEMSKPDMVAVAFDLRAKTFRHLMYEEYKAQRKGMPEDLAVQMKPLHDILTAMNVHIYEKEGYEADDIIGTLSQYCTERGYECDIVSGDRDDFQLVNDFVRVIMPVTRGGMSEVEIYDKNAILEKYGFAPTSIIDLKAIMGDSSDNIKGVAGIGEKGATELIKTFGCIEKLYENLEDERIKKGVRAKLETDKASAFLSKTLATIVKDVPIEITDEMLGVKEFDNERLSQLLEKYELSSIAKSLDIKAPERKTRTAEIITAPLDKYTEFFKENGMYFLEDADGTVYIDTPDGILKTDNADFLLTDESIKKYTFMPKSIYKRLVDKKPDITPFYDIETAQYVIDPAANGYELEGIIRDYLDENAESIEVKTACLKDVCALQLKTASENGQTSLLYDVEFPLTVCLADMENRGFAVDKNALIKFSEKLSENILALEERIYFLAGEKFNINSPKQLGVVLFEKLGLPHGKKTKTGYSTGADILAKLSGKHEIIDEILEYRQYVKLKSTYCDGLLKLIDESGRIHSSFNQTVTATGRISSTEPNLQNIPVRTPLGREMRAMFVTDDDYVLVDADYSQIELRVLAHIAKDKAMLDAFSKDADIHTVTAASVFGVPEDFVTPEMRRAAKAVNFGIVYGISDFSLAQDIGTTKAKAKQYIEGYLDLYSGVKAFMTNVVEKAKEDGYVTTLMGRRRYLPELSSSNYLLRSFGERAAMNAPIQGSAADIIKIAMVNTYRALIKEGFKARLILQVHDELIIECPEDEKDAVMQLLSREMENAMKLDVRLRADVQWGRTWYECK